MVVLVALASWLALAFSVPAVGADTLLFVDRLTVHDANGRVVGSAWPTSIGEDVMNVEFRLGSRPVILRLRSNGFDATLVRFANPGCTGQVRVDALEGDLYRYTAVIGPRQTVWIQSGGVADRTSRSTLTADGACIDHDPITDLSAPVTTTSVNLADDFVPPFRIRTHAGAPVPGVVAP